MRHATGNDIAALVALEQASFAGDRISRDSWRRLVRPGSHAVLVATESCGAIAGCAVILFRWRSKAARLYSLAVAANERGTGLGRDLLEAAETLARQKGCERMVLEVRADAGRLVAWYAGSGYLGAGARPGYYHDGGDAIRMIKPLKGAADSAGEPDR